MNPLILKFTQTDQYHSETQTIVWKDATRSRWLSVYGTLPLNTRAYLIGQGKIFTGVISQINEGVSLVIKEIEIFDLSADDFLSINAVNPEENARVKAFFQPYLANTAISYEAFKEAAQNRRLLNFIIVRKGAFLASNYNEHDRIILIDDDDVFEKFGVINEGVLVEYMSHDGFFNIKGKSIYDAISIFEKIAVKSETGKSNNASQLKRIEQYLKNHSEYRFTSFSGYFNVIHNKKAYLYSNITTIQYYVGGAYWDNKNPRDQTERFLIDGIWENGYDDKFTELVNAVPVGSMIAIKTTNKSYDQTIIKAVGEVKKNYHDGQTLEVEWEPSFVAFKLDYSGGYWDTFKRVTKPDHIQDIFFHQEEVKPTSTTKMENSLNQILYGPPGTGKTYHTIDKAVQIITGFSGTHSDNKKVFDDYRKLGQIEFVTFHQNYGYEDFMVGLRPDSQSEILRFRQYQGVFYKLAQRAKENYLASKNRKALDKDFDTVLSEFLDPLGKGTEIKVDMASEISYYITDIRNSSLQFRKSTGGMDHTLSIDTLRDLVAGVRSYPSGLKPYYKPLVGLLSEKQKTIGKAADLENFVLIIDEINRANISKVFGELITLLEKDKRLDEPNELAVTLPNGEENFVLPPNLYVIGTMNTADKSIALVDIALRRRFEFEGKYPNYEILRQEGYKESAVLLEKINNAIYKKKNTPDYLIGHAYFLSQEPIATILLRKVLPLLNEYFNNRIADVKDVFKEDTGWSVDFDEAIYEWKVVKQQN